MSTTDRYGLPLSTSSAVAAEHYQAGMDRLLAYGYGADQSFAAAVAADGEFALAHAGAALFAMFQGDGAAAKAAVERARGLVTGATRREKQHVEALAVVAGGEAARGLGLIEEHARAFAIHERDIATSANARLAMIDGAALLWRFELDGVKVGPLPWRPLADLAARVTKPGFIFGDVHAALAYASVGDDKSLSALIDGLRALDAQGPPIAGTVALPLVRGVAAFVAGDYAGALASFESVDGQIHRVGGSHAQWELFEETMVVCHLRLGRP